MDVGVRTWRYIDANKIIPYYVISTVVGCLNVGCVCHTGKTRRGRWLAPAAAFSPFYFLSSPGGPRTASFFLRPLAMRHDLRENISAFPRRADEGTWPWNFSTTSPRVCLLLPGVAFLSFLETRSARPRGKKGFLPWGDKRSWVVIVTDIPRLRVNQWI